MHIAMEYSSSYVSNFSALKTAGCKLSTYNNPNGFYIHAKAVVADYGLSTQNVYMGSINYSNASMTENRELGVYIADPASVQLLNATMASDYAGGTPY
jgi:phosphatidylserine/phosphatidylglycerophosphate/cardiolipin synthase-like enzyme